MTAVPAVSRPADAATAARDAVIDADDAVVDVMFPIVDDEQWPPYPAENVEAVLIAHDLAEIRSVPWFVTDRQPRRHRAGRPRRHRLRRPDGGQPRRARRPCMCSPPTEDELAPIVAGAARRWAPRCSAGSSRRCSPSTCRCRVARRRAGGPHRGRVRDLQLRSGVEPAPEAPPRPDRGLTFRLARRPGTASTAPASKVSASRWRPGRCRAGPAPSSSAGHSPPQRAERPPQRLLHARRIRRVRAEHHLDRCAGIVRTQSERRRRSPHRCPRSEPPSVRAARPRRPTSPPSRPCPGPCGSPATGCRRCTDRRPPVRSPRHRSGCAPRGRCP